MRLQPEFQRLIGTLEEPKAGWSFYRSEGCQLHVVYPGGDNPGCPIQKACMWISNFDLSSMEMRCRSPAALLPSSHEHRHARGTMYVEGEGHRNVASYTARYTPEIGAVYAKACRKFVDKRSRQTSIPDTELRRLADASSKSSDRSRSCSGPSPCTSRCRIRWSLPTWSTSYSSSSR